MKQNDYVVYSLRIANALTNKGFQIKATRVNYKNPKFMVFLFENTKELREAVERLTV